MPEQRKIANFTTGKVHSYWTIPIELFSGIFPRHKSHNSLACVVGFQRGSWERRTRALSIRPNIPVWNPGYSIRGMEQYIPAHWVNPSQVIRLQVSRAWKYEIKRRTLLPLFTCFGVARRPSSWNKRLIRWGWQYKEFATDICVTPLFSWRVQESLSNQAFERAVHSSGYAHIFI